ncbi:LptA/OstA family protein [Lichenihabitans psoromatis]|uniref:LptA/OstA family protein n=1 Tax=Lichenihabitans psoromatis TaxID=2528642 RepID=UPI0010383A26|nr:LptA/OstA family protein [Lichenihabitans psoromatis]
MTPLHRVFARLLALVAITTLIAISFEVSSGSALAQVPTAIAAPAKKATASSGSLLPGANSKDPVSVDAGKLDYFDKEQKLVYTGEVVAKQGDSTLRASVLTIFLNRSAKSTAAAGSAEEKPAAAPATPLPQDAATVASPLASSNSVRRMEAKGPVTIISKDQVGTGDNGVYDKAENKITLVGNVTLSQATNVIKGDKLVYDMTSGQAQVSSGQTLGRVKSVFTPGSGAPGDAKKPKHVTPKTAPAKADK